MTIVLKRPCISLIFGPKHFGCENNLFLASFCKKMAVILFELEIAVNVTVQWHCLRCLYEMRSTFNQVSSVYFYLHICKLYNFQKQKDKTDKFTIFFIIVN